MPDDRFKDIKVDTSPYAFIGYVDDPYNAYSGYVPEQFGEDEVEDFQPDSIFGLGNKKKQAERKLARAQKKLAKGKTKAATRLQNKATSLLNKISGGQDVQSQAVQKLSDINTQQQLLDQSLGAANQAGSVPLPVQPLSSQDLTSGAVAPPDLSMYPDTSGTSDLTGVENNPPPGSDEPTGWMADTKTLPDVTMVSKKSNPNMIVLVILAAVLLLGALVFFSHKSKK